MWRKETPFGGVPEKQFVTMGILRDWWHGVNFRSLKRLDPLCAQRVSKKLFCGVTKLFTKNLEVCVHTVLAKLAWDPIPRDHS